MPRFDWSEEDWFDEPNVPDLTVDIEDPLVIEYLYGPNGAPMATFMDRRPIAFGFQVP